MKYDITIVAGGRLTGRVGPYSVGALNIQTKADRLSASRPTNFSVLRLSRDVLRRSSVGVMFTGRSVAQSGVGSNAAYGVDGNFAFFTNLNINTYWARTDTDGLRGDDASYRARLEYNGDRYGVQAERLAVGTNFNPEIGFVRRYDMRRTLGEFRFSPRPRSIKSIRKFFWSTSLDNIADGAGQLETREWEGQFSIEFHNSDRMGVRCRP